MASAAVRATGQLCGPLVASQAVARAYAQVTQANNLRTQAPHLSSVDGWASPRARAGIAPVCVTSTTRSASAVAGGVAPCGAWSPAVAPRAWWPSVAWGVRLAYTPVPLGGGMPGFVIAGG